MKGWQIFLHSVRQVTGNLPEALQISLVPFALSSLVSILFLGQGAALQAGAEAVSIGESLSIMAGLVVMVAVSVWIAVAWHRFVLLNERPRGLLPAFYGDRAWSYFLRSIGYGMILVLVLMALSVLIGLLLMRGPVPDGNLGTNLLIGVLFQIPVLTVGFRLMAALPATALGNGQGFTDGWQATRGQTGDILVLAAACAVATTGISLLGTLVLGQLTILHIAFEVVFNWFATMVGASILTTLYGHYIQGRPLL